MTADAPLCVFCGLPIRPGEAVAGREPMAAHATCADAALADDSHWDAISAAGGEANDTSEPDAATTRGGCLGAAVLALALGLLLVA
jgi:hypothetical protein